MLHVLKKWTNTLFAEEEALVLLLLIIVTLVLVITLSSVVAPIIIAATLAFLMAGVSTRLTARGVPRWLALTLAFVLFVGFFFGVLLIVLPLVWKQMVNLVSELPTMVSKGQELLSRLPEQYPNLITDKQIAQWTELARTKLAELGQIILSFSLATIPALFSLLVYMILVPMLVFFFLKDSDIIFAWLARFFPAKRPVLTQVWHEMNAQIGNYVRGKVIEIIVIGLVSYVTFWILGLNYAALLGMGVGIAVIIPYIGAMAITIPIVVVGYMQWGFSAPYYTLLIAYLVIQALDANVFAPLLFSETVNLHPAAIILAVIVFGGLWGFWGVFFAIPLATLIKAVINAWPNHNVKGIEHHA